MSILSDRTDRARFAEASILFLASVALVAAVNIVLFSVASYSLLGASKQTLTQFGSRDGYLEGKVIGAVVSHMDIDASPSPARTKSPSASNADNMSSSTPVLPSPGTLTDETLAAPALNPTPNRDASTQTVATSDGSTRPTATDETPPPERSPSQEVGASPASIAKGTQTVATSDGSTRRTASTDETPPPDRNPSQEAGASPASIANSANPVQEASGATISTLAISHEQRDQIYQDFEMQRHDANLEEGSLAPAPTIDFSEKTTTHQSVGFYGSSAGPASKPPVRHAGSRGRGSIANKLNRAELSRLVQRSGALGLRVAR